MYMWYHWIQDHIKKIHFHVYWKPGTENWEYYFTKNPPITHNQPMIHIYLHQQCENFIYTQNTVI